MWQQSPARRSVSLPLAQLLPLILSFQEEGASRALARALVCNSRTCQATREEMRAIRCRISNLFHCADTQRVHSLWSYNSSVAHMCRAPAAAASMSRHQPGAAACTLSQEEGRDTRPAPSAPQRRASADAVCKSIWPEIREPPPPGGIKADVWCVGTPVVQLTSATPFTALQRQEEEVSILGNNISAFFLFFFFLIDIFLL